MQNEYDSEQIAPLMRVCKKCGVTKPLSGFRYKLTRAQMKSQGYAGNVLVTAEGKVCKDCRPKRKPPRELSNRELMRKADSGDIHPFVAKSRIAQNKKEANLLRKRAMDDRWEKTWAKEWDTILSPLREHLHKLSQVKRLAKLYGRKSKYAFLDFYTAALRKELSRLTLHYKTQLCRAPYTRWEEYIPEDVRDKINDAWLAMPVDERMRMRGKPDMVNYKYDPETHRRKQVKHTDALASRKALLGKPEKIPRATSPAPRISPYPKLETGHTPKTRLMPNQSIILHEPYQPSGVDWNNLLDEED